MIKLTTFIFCAFLAQFSLHAEDAAESPKAEAKGQLTVLVTNVEPSAGDVHIALFDSKKTFTKKSVQAGVVKVEKGKVSWTAKNLAPGEYGIAMFHDKNGDGKFNKNLIGLPKEDYGFSNNAKVRLGPPSWDEVKFTVKAGTNSHSIKVND